MVAGCTALGAVVLLDVARATADTTTSVVSMVSDPAGDTLFNNAPAFQDWVRGEVTRLASGNFELMMEMATPVPIHPPLPPPGVNQLWWVWAFDLDPTTSPSGYPFKEAGGRRPEFMVHVEWDGTGFAGTAIDRRPLLAGEEAILVPVQFSVSGTRVDAVLPSTLVGDVPASFVWTALTCSWSGPVGSEGIHFVDVGADAIFPPLTTTL
jgi:hypothetical protein